MMSISRRSCPHCGARDRIGSWWSPFGWPMRWDCRSCSRPLKFSGRRALLAAALRLPVSMVFVYGVFARVWSVAAVAMLLEVATTWIEAVEGVEPQ